MKKKFVLSLICAVLILGLCGCFESKEEKEKRKQYAKQASENAINYIENKYGFTPEVVSTECVFSVTDYSSSNCYDEMLVNLRYNNKTFTVDILGREESIDGADNYQYDEIVNALLKLMPNQNEIYNYNFYYGYEDGYTYDFNGIITEFYDGNNLEEIMTDKHLTGVVNYINHSSFEYLKDNMNFKFKVFSRLFIINYKSLRGYNNTSEYIYNATGTYMEEYFYKNSNNLREVVTLNYGQQYYYSFN